MINPSLFISESTISGSGGLFDINATLPLIIIQFLLIMVCLNIFYFDPLSKVIEQRNNYILNNLNAASQTLTEANNLQMQYEIKLNQIQKLTQLEIQTSQKIHKQIFEVEIMSFQKTIDNLLIKIMHDLENQKKLSLTSLGKNVDVLCHVIEKKLSI